MNILNKAWQRWKVIGGVVGNYQGRIIVLAFYYTVMVPFGLGVRLFGDPLRLKKTASASGWAERPPVGATLDDARRMF